MSWSLAVTAPNREAHVADMLRVFCFDHRVFRVRKRIVHRGAVVDVSAPAFPSYVFIAAREAWEQITEIIGVIGFIKHGGLDRVVAELDGQLNDRGLLPWCEEQAVQARFAIGDKIRVLNGSACGYRGIYQQPLSHDRALILLDWMGRMVPVSLDDRDLILDIPRIRSRQKRRRHRARRRRKEDTARAPAHSAT